MNKVQVSGDPHSRVFSCVRALAEVPDGTMMGFRGGYIEGHGVPAVCVEMGDKRFDLLSHEIHTAAFVAACFAESFPDKLSAVVVVDFIKGLKIATKACVPPKDAAIDGGKTAAKMRETSLEALDRCRAIFVTKRSAAVH